MDIFARELQTIPMKDYFPDYSGGDDFDAGCNYIMSQFSALNNRGRDLEIYFTSATSTAQIASKYLNQVEQLYIIDLSSRHHGPSIRHLYLQSFRIDCSHFNFWDLWLSAEMNSNLTLVSVLCTLQSSDATIDYKA